MFKLFAKVTDEELMVEIQQGKVSAFDELYKRYNGKMMSYFTRMLNYDRDKAEDALQDLFLKIIEKNKLYNPQYSFHSWVYKVATNICKNQYRQNEIHETAVGALEYTGTLSYAFFDDISDKMNLKEFNVALKDNLNELPYDKKATFLLRYEEDMTVPEIAEVLGCSEGTIKSRLHYTLKILAEKLVEYK